MADDLSVSRVTEALRDGDKPRTGGRRKRRPPPAPAPPAGAAEPPAGDTPPEKHVDLLV
jgi:hypothetical protein